MAGYSDVWLGAGFPDETAEGKTLGIKDGVYAAVNGVVVLDFELDNGDYVSVKTAGEILELAKNGAFLVGRCEVAEDTYYQFNFVGIALAEGTYTAGVMMTDGTISAGVSSSADDPIVISGS